MKFCKDCRNIQYNMFQSPSCTQFVRSVDVVTGEVTYMPCNVVRDVQYCGLEAILFRQKECKVEKPKMFSGVFRRFKQ